MQMQTAQRRLQKIAHALAAAWLTVAVFHPRHAMAQSEGKCTVFGTPQVSPALVELTSEAAGSPYRRGKPIHVILTIRAGLAGVYMPNYFGEFQQTCSHGFATEVLTLQGRAANPNELGCAFAGGPPQIRFVKLKPGEIRTWATDLPTKAIPPGKYCLYAEYLSPEKLVGWSVNLPDDKVLVAEGRITATPIAIDIR